MNPLDFLKEFIGNIIGNVSLFQPEPQNVQGFVPNVNISESELAKFQKINQPEPEISSAPKPQMSEDIIRKGLTKFGNTTPPPITQFAPQLAQAGQGLPDPLLPTILALMESGGGKNITSGANNIYNILPNQGITYPDLATAIIGGGPQNQQGLTGVLQEPQYNPYRQNGNLADFFNVFTPPGPEFGNPSLEELISRYNQLRELFIQ